MKTGQQSPDIAKLKHGTSVLKAEFTRFELRTGHMARLLLPNVLLWAQSGRFFGAQIRVAFLLYMTSIV